ncbi:hypothetical protein CASFOL_014188 [Castilleja foliolosa]|uniref:Uncharacterized protein n=1 Tax=Castilleja foliolosa TaxID=1961234 RepID=A0ABD3DM56_9LAMI
MSECYLLEHMPKDISLLKGLRVLKGFVVGMETRKNESCTLDDLAGLTNLVKLCIYTGLRQFPDSRNIVSLGNLTGLRKLTISWGGNAFKPRNDEGSDGSSKTEGSDGEKDGFPRTGGLPLGLEKLDLRYFPTSKTPHWLKVENLNGLSELKRLYIRAGKFSDLGQYQESDSWDWPVKKDVWKVEVLRLRYLPEIEMEWRQVQELFPELVYLEQVGCPRLSLVPCDANGVWRKPN